MTTEEQASALTEAIWDSVCHPARQTIYPMVLAALHEAEACGLEKIIGYLMDSLAQVLTTEALREAEARGLDEAAAIVESDCFGDTSIDFAGITNEQYTHNRNQIELAGKIRTMSKVRREGTP
jgi:hypothetical protein